MSFESNDERMERLEEQFAGMLDIQNRLAQLMRLQRRKDLELVKLIALVRSEHLALARFVFSGPLVPDCDWKRDCLKEVSDTEAAMKEIESKFAQLSQNAQNLLPPLPGA